MIKKKKGHVRIVEALQSFVQKCDLYLYSYKYEHILTMDLSPITLPLVENKCN